MIPYLFKGFRENFFKEGFFTLRIRSFKEGFSISSININNPMASINFSNLFTNYIKEHISLPSKELIFLCIGTDRSTGDALGPLVGHKLSKSLSRHDGTHIYGTLDEPIHAKNLESQIDRIYNNYKDPFVIAIDACLGRIGRVGNITIGHGPLSPGAGVNKNLPPIGNIHIMGIVNLGGYMEYMVLQNTRLQLVMKMADTIADGINFSMWKINRERLLS